MSSKMHNIVIDPVTQQIRINLRMSNELSTKILENPLESLERVLEGILAEVSLGITLNDSKGLPAVSNGAKFDFSKQKRVADINSLLRDAQTLAKNPNAEVDWMVNNLKVTYRTVYVKDSKLSSKSNAFTELRAFLEDNEITFKYYKGAMTPPVEDLNSMPLAEIVSKVVLEKPNLINPLMDILVDITSELAVYPLSEL